MKDTLEPQFSISVGLRSDVGRQRSNNEDAAAVFDVPGAEAAFVLCDGMGGLRAGDVAANEAVRVVQETLVGDLLRVPTVSGGANPGDSGDSLRNRRDSPTKGGYPQTVGVPDSPGEDSGNRPEDPTPISPDFGALLTEAIRRANDAVNTLNAVDEPTVNRVRSDGAVNYPRRSREDNSSEYVSPIVRQEAAQETRRLMGTTCVAGLVQGRTLYLAHAGDSRAYLFRQGQLTRLTDDHSFVAERVRAGDMTEAEARVSRFRNIVTRAIGIEPVVEPEIRQETLEAGDIVLVCSDGLTTMLDDPEIVATLHSPALQRGSLERAASALVDAANRAGGSDNITVVLLKMEALIGQEAGGREPRTGYSQRTRTPHPEPRTRYHPLSVGTRRIPKEIADRVPEVGETANSEVIESEQEGTKTMRGNQKNRSVRAGIVDIDAPRPRPTKGSSPVLWVVLGILLSLTLLMSLFSFVRPFRERIGQLAGNATPTPAATPGGDPVAAGVNTSPVDYSKLRYRPPVSFSTVLARGDLLTYSPGNGLYFVAPSTGKLARLDESGVAQITVEVLEVADEDRTAPIPNTRVFVTSDPQGNVYISKTKGKAVLKRSVKGDLLDRITGFVQPEAIAVDPAGNLYVVDYGEIKICRAYTPKEEAKRAESSSGQ